MRFLLDESADARLRAYLLALGHDVTSVVADYGAGLPDRDVLATAVREQRILIADDRDFGELVFGQQLPHAGVILFRLGRTDLSTRIAWLDRALTQHADHLDEFIVITPRGIRRRGSSTPRP
jgi:predicted nuclease of predicted toxin-antitoxin system